MTPPMPPSSPQADSPHPATVTPIEVGRAERERATALGVRLQGIAAARAQLEADFLRELHEFDRNEYHRFFDGIVSTAHWLAWACSMADGTAREHVRVARALHRMPVVASRMAAGELSYSKVRELTRLAPPEPEDPASDASPDQAAPEPPRLENEEELCDLAAEMTASQLSRTVRAYRTHAGLRIQQEVQRTLAWRNRDDGMMELRVILPPEQAAEVRAALDVAEGRLRRDAQTPAAEMSPDAEKPRVNMVDALLEVTRTHLDEDTSAPVDDHHLVTVHVSATDLIATTAPSGTATDVPAGTSDTDIPTSTAHVPGVGAVDPETARRLACDAPLVPALIDASGDVLALGRTQRLVTRTQRRALGIRDHHTCRFPGCVRRRRLHAHHVQHWANGGPTDLDNLMLLCNFHHTCVHEGQINISGGHTDRTFTLPNGNRLTDQYPLSDAALADELAQWASEQAARPDGGRIFPPRGGEGFLLHECVGALWSLTEPPSLAS